MGTESEHKLLPMRRYATMEWKQTSQVEIENLVDGCVVVACPPIVCSILN